MGGGYLKGWQDESRHMERQGAQTGGTAKPGADGPVCFIPARDVWGEMADALSGARYSVGASVREALSVSAWTGRRSA